MREQIDQRFLGAFRFVSAATLHPITRPLLVQADGLEVVRNRRYVYAVSFAEGLDDFTAHFIEQIPEEADFNSFEVFVSDPSDNYLPRRFSFRLPRVSSDDSLFQVLDVPLCLSTSAKTLKSWALFRTRIALDTDAHLIGGALVSVTPDGGRTFIGTSQPKRLPSGAYDSPVLGEVLVAIPGVPVNTWSETSVSETSVPATIEVVIDPDAEGYPDPEDLETRKTTLLSTSFTRSLVSGKTLKEDTIIVSTS